MDVIVKKRELLDRIADHPLSLYVIELSVDGVDMTVYLNESDANKINFPLLADVDKKVIGKYGVWVEKSIYGKTYMGIQRDSFLIDREGKNQRHP